MVAVAQLPMLCAVSNYIGFEPLLLFSDLWEIPKFSISSLPPIAIAIVWSTSISSPRNIGAVVELNLR